MAYREKVAWLTLSAMLMTLVPFFILAESGRYDLTELPNTGLLWAFALTAAVQALIIGVGHAVLRWRFHEDAIEPADERDRVIDRLSTRWAYYVLIAGIILVGVAMPFNNSGWQIVLAALAAILMAEVVHHGLVIVSYRRSA
jgi:hypothetical protein